MPSDLVQCASRERFREVADSVETLPAHEHGLYAIPPTPPELAALIRQATAKIKPHENTFRCEMEHVLHAGMYARTCRVPVGMAFTSVLIRIPTIIVVHGDCAVFAGETWRKLSGYHVLKASANRIQAYCTMGDTEITMLFPSNARTVEEAEAEFTDEAADLLSRRSA